MSAISEIISGQTPMAALGGGASDSLGKDDFLKLLITQLKNQDPLNPSDPTEFTAQLAQFSSLEQLFSVNENLQQLQEDQRLSALNLIDREVSAEQDLFTYSGEPVQVGYRLAEPADEVRLEILDAAGRTVAVRKIENPSTGDRFITWDGLDEAGAGLPDGEYGMVVNAIRGEETPAALTALIGGRVTGVRFEGGRNILSTSFGDVALERLRSIRNPEI